LFVGESLLMALFGAALGVALATATFRTFDLSLFIPNFQSFRPTTETLAAAFVIALLIGVSSVVVSAYRVSGLTIADALRSTE
jgi:ABC-type antimicrobial peptide transport system permease subunit